MTEKKKKTKKYTSSAVKIINRFDKIIDLLERINENLLTKNTSKEISGEIHYIAESEPPSTPKIISGGGQTKKIDYKLVMEEARELCSIDEAGKTGFNKAQEIIKSYGVERIKFIPAKHYSELIQQFRKAVKTLRKG